MWTNYSTDQQNFTGPMFHITLKEKPYETNFKVLPVKIQRQKTDRGGGTYDETIIRKCFMKSLSRFARVLLRKALTNSVLNCCDINFIYFIVHMTNLLNSNLIEDCL